VAFANADGETIAIGISDKTRRVVGVDLGQKRFMPGSMARQTHIQMLVYLTRFEYLKENFLDFFCMLLIVID